MKINKKDIETFIVNYFIKKEGKSISKIIHKVNLISEGYLDSLDMLTFSLAIEKQFKIKINPNTNEALTNFSNFNTLVENIYQKGIQKNR